MREIKDIFSYLLLSAVAVGFVLIMVFAGQSSKGIITTQARIFFTGAFIGSCLFGISLAIYPNWWRGLAHKKNQSQEKQLKKVQRPFLGHHPDCDVFKNHVVLFKDKPLCAGCLGLALGSSLSILLIIIYFFYHPGFSSTFFYVLLVFGLFTLFIVYLEIMLPKRYLFVHILTNSALVVSFFFIALSVFEVTQNIIYGFVTIILCFLWLDTKIRLSKQQHRRICASCDKTCKAF